MRTQAYTCILSAVLLTGFYIAETTCAQAGQPTLERYVPGIEVAPGNSRILGLALSPDETRLYAAYWTDTGSDPVVVYSTADFGVLNSSSMAYGSCHAGVAVSTDGRFIFTPSYYQANVSRFDSANGYARTELSAGGTPGGIALSPNGNRLVVGSGREGGLHQNNDAIYIYNVGSGAFAPAGQVTLPDEPIGLDFVFASDSGHVYVPTSAQNSTGARVYEISLAGSPSVSRYLQFDTLRLRTLAGDDNRLYVADAVSSTIWVVDRATLTIANTIVTPSLPSAMALDPTGKYLFSACTNGLLEVYSTDTDLLAGSIQLAGGPSQIVLSADGTRAFVSHYDEYGSDSLVGGISVVSVPEPSTLALAGMGVLGILLCSRSKASKLPKNDF